MLFISYNRPSILLSKCYSIISLFMTGISKGAIYSVESGSGLGLGLGLGLSNLGLWSIIVSITSSV